MDIQVLITLITKIQKHVTLYIVIIHDVYIVLYTIHTNKININNFKK